MTPAPGEPRVKVVYPFRDLYRANPHMAVRSPACWIIVIAACVALYFGLRSGSDDFGGSAFWEGIGIAIAIFFGLMLLLGLTWLRVFRIQRALHMKQGITYVFADAGVAAEVTGAKTFADWSYVKGAFETKHDLFVKMRRGCHVIPKSQVTAEQSEAIRQIVREHVRSASL